jgi:hypothetical protein
VGNGNYKEINKKTELFSWFKDSSDKENNYRKFYLSMFHPNLWLVVDDFVQSYAIS